jgi:phosphoenolpyruvate carboxykinase (ATP)
MPIADTRRIVNAILNGELADVPFTPEPAFGLAVPALVAGVRPEILDVRAGSPDKVRYDERARKLAERFTENFRTYAGAVNDAVRQAGPRVAG